jgi:hypothetical protein
MNEPVPESDIRIDRDGVWFYRGMEMFRRDIVRLFYQHLQRNVSGHYFIEIGQQRCRLEVEDTAFVVWAVHWKETLHPCITKVFTSEIIHFFTRCCLLK